MTICTGKWLGPLTRNNNTLHYRRYGTAVHDITDTTFIFKIIKSSFIVIREICLTHKTHQDIMNRKVFRTNKSAIIEYWHSIVSCIFILIVNAKFSWSGTNILWLVVAV